MKVGEMFVGASAGRLTVLEITKRFVGSQNHYFVLCSCECGEGNNRWYRASAVGSHVRSCGCLVKEAASAANKTHGKSRSRTYNSWRGMLERCFNENNIGYANYKDKAPPDEWRNFESFLADMGERPEGKTLERIDNTKPYSKHNCTWADAATQNRNKSTNVWLEHANYGKKVLADALRLENRKRSTSVETLRKLGWTLIK